MANPSPWAQVNPDAPPAAVLGPGPMSDPNIWAQAPPIQTAPLDALRGFTPMAPAPAKMAPVMTPGQEQIAADRAALQKVRMEKARPWGFEGAPPSAEFPEGLAPNHPGKLGKIAHAFSTLGNIAGDIFAPAVMANIPGTQLNRQVQEGGLTHRLNAEIGEESQNAYRSAETGHTQAETAKTEEETKEAPGKEASAEALQGAETAVANEKVANGPDLAAAYAHAVNAAIKNGQDPSQDPVVQHMADAITAIQKQPLPRGREHVDLQGPGGAAMGGTYDPTTGKYFDAAGKEVANPRMFEKPNQAGMVTMIVPDPNNPGGGIVQRLGAGATVAPGAQTAAGFNAMNTPTTTQRTAAGRAQTVLEMAPEVLQRIDATASQMGPIAGRWNEFMQGRVGAPNVQMSQLRSDLLMMSSAVALAHAQGRLPENLREEFDREINAPNQTSENLKGAITTMLPWLQKVQSQGERPGTTHAAEAAPSVPPQGADVKVKGSDGKMYWGNSKTKQVLGPAQ